MFLIIKTCVWRQQLPLRLVRFAYICQRATYMYEKRPIKETHRQSTNLSRDQVLITKGIHTYVKRDLYIRNEICKRDLLNTRDPLTIDMCLLRLLTRHVKYTNICQKRPIYTNEICKRDLLKTRDTLSVEKCLSWPLARHVTYTSICQRRPIYTRWDL